MLEIAADDTGMREREGEKGQGGREEGGRGEGGRGGEGKGASEGQRNTVLPDYADRILNMSVGTSQ